MVKPTTPRRHVRTFQPQFWPALRSLEKLQTLRPLPKRMPQVGDLIDCRGWSAQPYRSKQLRILEATLSHVEPITITSAGAVHFAEYSRLAFRNRYELARADGFPDWPTMFAWFAAAYRKQLDDDGFVDLILLRWDPTTVNLAP